MNNLLIYTNDDLVDLIPDQKVTITLKRFDVANITGRFINYTNSFKAPWTSQNLINFGFANDERSRSTVPYKLIPTKIVQNGIELMPNAFCYVTKPNNRELTLAIVENIFDFFNFVKEKKLKDVTPISDSAWTASAIDSARTNTSGIISAVLSWGKSGNIYQFDYFLPCFYYHTIITSILQSTGLTLSGDILTDSRFKDLVIAFPGEFLYQQTFVEPVNGKAFNSVSLPNTGITVGVPIKISYDTIVYGTNNFPFAPFGDRYEFPLHCNATIVVPTTITVSAFNDGTAVTVDLVKNGVTILTSATFSTPAQTQTLTYTGDFTLGDTLEVITSTDAPIVGIDYTIGGGDANPFIITPNRTVNRNYVYWNELWSDIDCIDLLRDFFTRFFVIPKQVGNNMVLKTTSEICTDISGAVDWTDKLVKSDDEEIDLDPQLAQQNFFRYSGDGDLGMGSIDIDNEIIEPSKGMFTSVFESTTTQLVNFGYRVAVVPVYDADSSSIDDMSESAGLRIFTLKSRSTEPSITFDATPRTDFKLAYFVDSTQTKDTGFKYFLNQFYSQITNALQICKIPRKFFNLNEIDIAEYDPHKMVYDGVSYSLINTIDKFISGKITKVDLFKII